MIKIPYARQAITEDDIQAVVRTLRSEWITQGPAVEAFEHDLTLDCGATYALAVSNGTAALHLACMAMGLTSGDYLWTSANTFVASANCGLYCGASVDFVDIDPRTYNMSVEALQKKLVAAEREGTLPKIVVTVHFAGQPCQMEPIKALADRYGFRIIEDASHAIGASYLQSRIGACKYSDITVFSFHPVKLITTGEGGAAVTNNEMLHENMKLLRSHGITRNGALFESQSNDSWYYEQQQLGHNYRMTDIQAALGSSQLTRLEQYVERRHTLARQYTNRLEPLDLAPPWQHPSGRSAYHLYVVTLSNADERRVVYERLRESGIGVTVHYIPVYYHPYYKALDFYKGLCPNAEDYYERALSLPLFPAMSDQEQDYVVDRLTAALL